MRKVIFPTVAMLAICSSLAATPAKSHKRRHPATSASATPARKHPTLATKYKTSAKATKTTARRKGKAVSHPLRSYQQAPTPDRYKEIQQALTSKGYFHGEPSGEWSPDSAEALKRFQAEQNLMPDGKINSLSLIALGLGPKRLTAKSDTATAPQATPPVAPTAAPK